MHNSLKYYIYVSDTKVDMLYSQIPEHLLSWFGHFQVGCGNSTQSWS